MSETLSFLDEVELIGEAYAKKQTVMAIMRAEQLKNRTWNPDPQTRDVCLKIANEWMYYQNPEVAPQYYYKIRSVGNTEQIYQEVDG